MTYKMTYKTLIAVRSLTLAGFATALLAVNTAWADGTAEGTVITNTATVSFTDANTNTYSDVSASVNVTVGFKAGVDVVAGAATVTPVSPSTSDTLTFQVINIGNGTDSMTLAESISVGGVITVTGYRLVATTHPNLAALNTALAGTAMAVRDTITIKVVYDVLASQGGVSTVYTMTGTSRRDGTVSDNDATTITPSETIAVAVTPDGAQNVQQLPSNGTNYTFTFTVQNNGNGPEDFDLLGSSPGSVVITIVSVNGVAGDSTRISALAAAASQTIDVIYSVADVAAGSTDTLNLRARSVTQPSTFDDGFADLTVIRPSLAITKQAWLDDQSAEISADVLPGQFIQYKVTVTNNGDAPASSVQVSDPLPSEVTYTSNSDPGGSWSSITESAGTVTATLSGTLAASGGSAYFWIRVQIN